MEEFTVDRWASDRKEFREVTLPRLETHGADIGLKAKAGNRRCKTIMANYAILRKSFDPIYHRILKENLEAYLKEATNG